MKNFSHPLMDNNITDSDVNSLISFLKNNKKKITYTNISNFLIRNPHIMKLNKSANNIFQGNKIK